MRVALATERPVLGNVKANLKTIESRVTKNEADLFLFGELYITGYAIKDRVADLAMRMDGPEIGKLKDLAKSEKKAIVAGFPRLDDERRAIVYDSAVMIDKRGKADAYDKWFPANFGPFEEKLYYGVGRRLPLMKVDDFTVGVEICYDLFFPELSKAYALMGADLLVNISASPTTSRKNFELVFPARAIENANFLAYANVAGTQEDLVFWGGSQIWGPRGDQKVLAPYTDPSFVTADLDLSEIDAARPMRPTLRDTREDMVAALAKSLRRMYA